MEKPCSNSVLIARCQEIQINLGATEVPDFEFIPLLGMTVRFALHIRGLPLIDYKTLKLVAYHFLGISYIYTERIVSILAEIEFIRIQSEGKTIKAILPTVPYYEQVYERIGQYSTIEAKFSEPEQLAITIVDRLAQAPENIDRLRHQLGVNSNFFQRNVDIGTEGNYLLKKRFRGKDILINPTYFSENSTIFGDSVAASGSSNVKNLLAAIKKYQGWPLNIIEHQKRIGDFTLNKEQLDLLTRIAQDGMVKPPSIQTKHSGNNYFIFTPSPQNISVSPTKRDIYEKALAIVSAVRQGQFLAKQYAIRSPGAVLYKLKTDLCLSKPTTEFSEQYKNLVVLRVGRFEPVGSGFYNFKIIDTPENRESLDIAYDLVNDGSSANYDIDDEARQALLKDQKYVESLVAATELRKTKKIEISQENEEEIAQLFLRG